MYSAFVIGAAVFRSGVPLDTVAHRRAAQTGWVSSSFDVRQLIAASDGLHPGLGVQLYFEPAGAPRELIGRVGPPAVRCRTRASPRLTAARAG